MNYVVGLVASSLSTCKEIYKKNEQLVQPHLSISLKGSPVSGFEIWNGKQIFNLFSISENKLHFFSISDFEAWNRTPL